MIRLAAILSCNLQWRSSVPSATTEQTKAILPLALKTFVQISMAPNLTASQMQLGSQREARRKPVGLEVMLQKKDRRRGGGWDFGFARSSD